MLTIVLFIIAGLILMFVEMFVPGGIIGFIGMILMGYGVYLSFDQYGSINGVMVLTLCVLATIAVGVLAFKFLPNTYVGRRIILADVFTKETGYHSDSYSDDHLTGKEGIAESSLRPAGIAIIDGERIDVVTEGEYLAPHTRIKVLRVDGNRVVVEEA